MATLPMTILPKKRIRLKALRARAIAMNAKRRAELLGQKQRTHMHRRPKAPGECARLTTTLPKAARPLEQSRNFGSNVHQLQAFIGLLHTCSVCRALRRWPRALISKCGRCGTRMAPTAELLHTLDPEMIVAYQERARHVLYAFKALAYASRKMASVPITILEVGEHTYQPSRVEPTKNWVVHIHVGEYRYIGQRATCGVYSPCQDDLELMSESLTPVQIP